MLPSQTAAPPDERMADRTAFDVHIYPLRDGQRWAARASDNRVCAWSGPAPTRQRAAREAIDRLLGQTSGEIESLGLLTRTANVLGHYGGAPIRTVAQLFERGPEKLWRRRGFGMVSMLDLVARLREHGYGDQVSRWLGPAWERRVESARLAREADRG